MMASDLPRALHLVGDARALQRKLNCLSCLAADRPLVLRTMLHGVKHEFTFSAGLLRDEVAADLAEVVGQLAALGIELDQQQDQALPVLVSMPPAVAAPAAPEPAPPAEATAAEEVPDCPVCYATTRRPCGRRDCGVLALTQEAA